VFGVDPVDGRRRLAATLGVERPVTPDEVEGAVFAQSDARGADVVIEVTGNPAVIQNAIAVCGREGTIAIVSFYGARSAQLEFNDRFHFLRQRIVSCQVGRVGSGLEPRWDRSRRFDTSARLCEQFRVSRMLTHESMIDDATAAYRFLDEHPNDVTALAFNYGDSPLTEASHRVQ
jgi:threonine dehydrogenase-like Zn-dependent dehydrogenase